MVILISDLSITRECDSGIDALSVPRDGRRCFHVLPDTQLSVRAPDPSKTSNDRGRSHGADVVRAHSSCDRGLSHATSTSLRVRIVYHSEPTSRSNWRCGYLSRARDCVTFLRRCFSPRVMSASRSFCPAQARTLDRCIFRVKLLRGAPVEHSRGVSSLSALLALRVGAVALAGVRAAVFPVGRRRATSGVTMGALDTSLSMSARPSFERASSGPGTVTARPPATSGIVTFAAAASPFPPRTNDAKSSIDAAAAVFGSTLRARLPRRLHGFRSRGDRSTIIVVTICRNGWTPATASRFLNRAH